MPKAKSHGHVPLPETALRLSRTPRAPYECKHCDTYKSDSYPALYMHVKSIHRDKFVPLNTGRPKPVKPDTSPRPETVAKFSRSPAAPWLCLYCDYKTDRFPYLRAHHERMHKGKHEKPLAGSPKGWLNDMTAANGSAPPEALAVRSVEPASVHRDHPTAEEEAKFIYCPKCAFPVALAEHATLQILKFSKR